MKRILCAALCLSASILTLPAASFTENFNTAGALGNFNLYQNATTPAGNPYVENATLGAGGTGGLEVLTGSSVTADSTLIYKPVVFDFSADYATLNISALFNVSTQTAGGNRILQLGFVNENTSGMNGNAGLAFTSLRLSSTGSSGNVYTPQWQTKTAAGGTVTTSLGPNVTLTPGEWYLLTGTFINAGGGNIQAKGLLQDWGTSGTASGASVFSFANTNLTSLDIATDSTVYAALRGFKADGLNAVDNFSAASLVPEPTTASLILLGLGALLARSQKTRRQASL